MICRPCTRDEHGDCTDQARLKNIRYGLIPAGTME